MDVNTNSTSTPDSQNMYNYMNGILMNPSVFIILALVVIVYIIIFLSLGNSAQTGASFYPDATPGSSVTSGSSTNMIIIIVIGVLIVLVLFNGFQYFFGVDIMASLSNLFSGEPQINIVVDQNQGAAPSVVPEIKYVEQVFNIPGNEYGYEDAKTLCSAYGSRLATYDEVEKAYDRGAEWCNYGWSDKQMALFPTQKSTFDQLQTIEGHEHDCGRTGINGGYIANPRVKFGVNCYGYKPKMTQEEEEMMQTNSPYPKTEKDIAMENRVEYWKTKLDEILVSPFNYNTWSRL
jgi:Extracellular link domain